jgi:hypothetical protein
MAGTPPKARVDSLDVCQQAWFVTVRRRAPHVFMQAWLGRRAVLVQSSYLTPASHIHELRLTEGEWKMIDRGSRPDPMRAVRIIDEPGPFCVKDHEGDTAVCELHHRRDAAVGRAQTEFRRRHVLTAADYVPSPTNEVRWWLYVPIGGRCRVCLKPAPESWCHRTRGTKRTSIDDAPPGSPPIGLAGFSVVSKNPNRCNRIDRAVTTCLPAAARSTCSEGITPITTARNRAMVSRAVPRIDSVARCGGYARTRSRCRGERRRDERNDRYTPFAARTAAIRPS